MRAPNFSIGPTSRGLRAAQGAATNIGRAIRAMHRALYQMDWADRPDGTARRVHLDFGPPYTPVARAITAIDTESASFIACFDLGPVVDGDRIGNVLRFATRANAALLNGCFDVDVDAGTMHFRSGVVFGGGELSEEVIRATLGAAVQIVNAHVDALMQVAAGQADADEAIVAVWSVHDRSDDDAETA